MRRRLDVLRIMLAGRAVLGAPCMPEACHYSGAGGYDQLLN